MKLAVSEERGVRYLHFGSPWVQGAMRIARPFALELEYTREMMMPLLLRAGTKWPASVLQVGLGAGSITKFLYRHRPAARLVVVELLPEVVATARQMFRLPEDEERIRIVPGCGHEHLAAHKARYDFIVVDGYDERGRSGMLDTPPFYANCRARLSREGMAAFNLLDGRRGVGPSVQRIRAAFDDRVLVLPPSEAGNTVVLAATGRVIEEPLTDLRSAARDLKAAIGLDLSPTLARLEAARAAPGGLLRL